MRVMIERRLFSHHGGQEVLLYPYASPETEKRCKVTECPKNVLSEDIGNVKQPHNPEEGGDQRCFSGLE